MQTIHDAISCGQFIVQYVWFYCVQLGGEGGVEYILALASQHFNLGGLTYLVSLESSQLQQIMSRIDNNYAGGQTERFYEAVHNHNGMLIYFYFHWLW